jgi:LmbE family N-acetylglucosaminyl deacetylase
VVMRDIRELWTILSIWAHPDDEAYLCGGIMAMARAADSRVVCATATRGELGVTDPARWPPAQLPAIREAELAACLRILGVTEHRWLGYPDGSCADVDLDSAADQIAKVIHEIAPDTILTFAPDGQTGHPDHIAVHHWTVEAVRRTGIGTLHVVANTPSGWTIACRSGSSLGRSWVIRRLPGLGRSASTWHCQVSCWTRSMRHWPRKRVRPRRYERLSAMNATERSSASSGSRPSRLLPHLLRKVGAGVIFVTHE